MQNRPEHSLLDENGQLVSAETDTYLDTTHVRFKTTRRSRLPLLLILGFLGSTGLALIMIVAAFYFDDDNEYYDYPPPPPTILPLMNWQNYAVNSQLLPDLRATEIVNRVIPPEKTAEVFDSIPFREQWIAGVAEWTENPNDTIPLCLDAPVQSKNKLAYLSVVDTNAYPQLATLYVYDWESGATCRMSPYNVLDYAKIAWSRDGEKIATTILGFANRPMGVYLLDQNEPSPTLLSDSCTFAAEPDWSPDGTQLVFAGVCGSGTRDAMLYIHDFNLNQRIPLVSGDSPIWSPDGTKIAYLVRSPYVHTLHVYDLENLSSKPIRGIPFTREWMSWSPDSRSVAYADSTGDIYTVDVMTQDLWRLTDERGIERHPLWMPDGQIAFLSDWQVPLRDGGSALFIMSSRGEFVRRWSSYMHIISFDWYIE